MSIMISCLKSKNLCTTVLFFIHFTAYIYLAAGVMCKYKILSSFAQSIIIKISPNENVKPVEIQHRLNVQFGYAFLRTFQVCKWYKLLKVAVKMMKHDNLVWKTARKVKLVFTEAITDKVPTIFSS